MNHRNTIYLSEGPYRAKTPYQSEGSYQAKRPNRTVSPFPESLMNHPQRDVPWAGAEQEWQRGAIVPLPAPVKTQPAQAVENQHWMLDIELSSDELQTVYSSFATSPSMAGKWPGWFRGALVGLIIGGASVGLGMYFHPGAQTTEASESWANLPMGSAAAVDRSPDVSGTMSTPGESEAAALQVASFQKPQVKTVDGAQRKTRSMARPAKRWRGEVAQESAVNLAELTPGATPVQSGPDSVPLTGGEQVAEPETSVLTNAPQVDAAEPPADQLAMGASLTESPAENVAEPAAVPTTAVSALEKLLRSDSSPSSVPREVNPDDGLPDRDAIRMAMENIAPQVEKCKSATSGKMVVHMVVSGDTGRVISSRVIDDIFRGTATGVCAARVVRNVKLPSFERDKVVIKYPFVI